MMSFQDSIATKIKEYYAHYYGELLGLPNIEERIVIRLNEDKGELNHFDLIKKSCPFFCVEPKGKKVLVLGAGTGGEFVKFSRMGYQTYALEPDDSACNIIRLKCDLYDLDVTKVCSAYGEHMPYEDDTFDFVWSWSVLEHVQDYEEVLREMYRVLKPDGWAFLMMPDYRQLYEGHYKVFLPGFLPRYITRAMLKMYGRSVKYYDQHVNTIRQSRVRNCLQHLGFESMFMYLPFSKEMQDKGRNVWNWLVYKMSVVTGIQRSQFWFLRKP